MGCDLGVGGLMPRADDDDEALFLNLNWVVETSSLVCDSQVRVLMSISRPGQYK